MSIFKFRNANKDVGSKVSYKPTTCIPQTNDRQFIEDVIVAHNKRRQDHGVPHLCHNPELSKVAQKWAEHLARNNSFQHSHACLKGEKMGDDAVEQWYSEISMFKFGMEPSNLSQVGHFTQLVWRASKEVGVGRARARDGKTIVVANYLPAGNVIGHFTRNVPPKGARPTHNGNLIANTTSPLLSPNNNTSQTVHVFPATRTNANSNYQHSPTSTVRPKYRPTQQAPLYVGNANLVNNNSPFKPYNLQASKTDPFSSKIKPEEVRRDKMSKVSTSTRTYTKTEGQGSNTVTTTVVEETITYSDGRKEVNTKETVTKGQSGITPAMKNLSLSDKEAKTDSKPAPTQSISEFRAESLKAHNVYRAKHSASPLRAAKDLDDYAQKWADHLAASGTFKHSDCKMSDGTHLGENIACKWSSGGADYTGQEVVDYWYSEIKVHNFNSSNPGSGSGHFSQVVWKGSKEVGIGKAKGKDGKVIIVGSYRPAGNFVGAFRENVLPARK